MRKHFGYLVLILLLGSVIWAGFPELRAQGSRASGPVLPSGNEAPGVFHLKDLRPGMKGVGRTVFNGDKVSEFNVEILGVVENFQPRQSAVFAKLSGGPLADTGVFAGMSGSPVFIDGKILGAVAFSFNFSKEAIAGITPLENMILDVEDNSTRDSREAPPDSAVAQLSFDPTQSLERQLWNLVPVSRFKSSIRSLSASSFQDGLPSSSEIRPIDTPLMLSGFPPGVIDHFAPEFRALGLTPVMGGAVGGPDVPADTLAEAADVGPGSGVGAQLIRGMFGATAAGKVTYRNGNRIYAFGHPFLQIGPTDLPMTKTKIITLLPNLMSSTELSVPTELIGTIKQDRSSGIYGEIGQLPRMIPVTVRLHSSRNSQQVYNFETVNNRFLTPLLVNMTVFSALTASERALGESTLELQSTISLKDKQRVKIENFVSGDANASTIASLSVANPVNFLMQSGLKGVEIDSIEVDVTSWDEKRQAVLERIWTDQREVSPGEKLEVSAVLRKTDGEEIISCIPVTIPDQTPAGPLTLSVLDGGSLSQVETRETRPTFQAKNVTQLIRTINQARQNNRLYVRLTRNEQAVAIYGESYPSIPPSLEGVLLADRTSGTSQTTFRSSPLGTFEGSPMNLLLSGQRSLILSVVK